MRWLLCACFSVIAGCNIYVVTEKQDSGNQKDTAINLDSGDVERESGWDDSAGSSDTGASDGDGDGYTVSDGDCDDANGAVYPGADELCDDVDNDCDEAIDEDAIDASGWYTDEDGDGYGTDDSEVLACDAPKGLIDTSGDCDDTDDAIHPAAEEISCDDVDQNCDGANQGGVWFEDEKGVVTDLTTTFSAGSSAAPVNHVVQDDGTMTFCDGVWYAGLEVDADVVTLMSVNGVDATTVSTSGDGPVLRVAAASAYVTVEGLTLANGSSDWGGCISSQQTDVALEIVDSMLYTCAATEGGGGIYMESGTLDISGSELYVAKSTNGGCVYSGAADVTLDSSAVSTCGASSGGGGLFVSTGDLTITDSDIEDNSAAYGGAIQADYGDLIIDTSTLEGNSASSAGGAMFLQTGSAVLTDVSLIDNEADSGAGMYLGSAVVVVDCPTTGGVSANAASLMGGGAYIEDSGVLESSSCNWGYRSDENAPDDVYLASSRESYLDFDSTATFECDGSAGSCR